VDEKMDERKKEPEILPLQYRGIDLVLGIYSSKYARSLQRELVVWSVVT
jgi:hypothetical protein